MSSTREMNLIPVFAPGWYKVNYTGFGCRGQERQTFSGRSLCLITPVTGHYRYIVQKGVHLHEPRGVKLQCASTSCDNTLIGATRCLLCMSLSRAIVYLRSLCRLKNRYNLLNTRPISKFQRSADS